MKARVDIKYWVITLIIFVLGGCVHKELCEDHSHVERILINFDWSKSPEANPKVMRLYMYNQNNSNCEIYELPKDGGIIDIQKGIYNIICFNWDNLDATFLLDDATFETHTLATREGDYIEDVVTRSIVKYIKSQEDTVRIEPNMMWGASGKGVQIEQNDGDIVSYDSQSVNSTIGMPTITIFPSPIVARYTFEINKVTNIRSAAKLRGTLSGMGATLMMSDMTTDPSYTAKVPFEPKMNVERNQIYGEFFTFGNFDNINNVKKEFSLFVWLSNKEKYLYRWDVSSQVSSAPDKYNVHIVLDSLTLPETFDVGGNGGFDVDVEGWDEEYIDVEM